MNPSDGTPARDHPTSLTLLERLRDNDQEAWKRVIHLYSGLINHWLRQAGLQGADADDVRQEIFHAVSVSLPAFHRDRPGDTFRGWLRGITRNKLLDHFRQRARQPLGAGGSQAQLRFQELPQPELSESATELGQLYHRALELLRCEFEESSWRAFWLTAVDGRSAPDVADQLGMTAAAVRKAKSRVLRRLKEEVGDLIA